MRTWPNTAGGVLSIQQKGALLWPRVWTFWGSFRGNLVTCTQEMRYSHNQAKVYLSTTRVGQAHSSCVLGTLFTSSPKAFGLGIGVHKFWGYGPVLRGCPCFKQKTSTQIHSEGGANGCLPAACVFRVPPGHRSRRNAWAPSAWSWQWAGEPKIRQVGLPTKLQAPRKPFS